MKKLLSLLMPLVALVAAACSDAAEPVVSDPVLEQVQLWPELGSNGILSLTWSDPQGESNLPAGAAAAFIVSPESQVVATLSSREVLLDGSVRYSFEGGRDATLIRTHITDADNHAVEHVCTAPEWTCTRAKGVLGLTR